MDDIASMSIEELGRYVVGRPWWEWRPGMRCLHAVMGPAIVVAVGPHGFHVCKAERLAAGFRVEEDECLPDLHDAATVGALLGVVEAMAGGPVSVVYRGSIPGSGTPWQALAYEVRDASGSTWTEAGPTRANALVALADALHGAA